MSLSFEKCLPPWGQFQHRACQLQPPQKSPSRPMPNRVTQLKPWKRASGPVDTRDELLMALLASEAIVDSRDFDILHSEDVEELKKVCVYFDNQVYLTHYDARNRNNNCWKLDYKQCRKNRSLKSKSGTLLLHLQK